MHRRRLPMARSSALSADEPFRWRIPPLPSAGTAGLLIRLLRWLFAPEFGSTRLWWVRWLFLRALGLIYFSAFYSLYFQICGLIGPDGILPVRIYLQEVSRVLGGLKYWYAPTGLWLADGDRALVALCALGMIASALLVLNVWPRGMLAACFLLFLSFVAGAQDFADYQSDGMLLAAGLLSLWWAPPGLRPGWGETHRAPRAVVYLLRWEWFRIYFESGVAKWVGHDPQWRHLTAMDHYYETSPLPTWLAWYAQQLPHRVHAATALLTLILELGLVWLIFLPRQVRAGLFLLTSLFQIGIILTANYAFLNYLVLAEGLLLLDDEVFARWRLLPARLHRVEQHHPDIAWVDLEDTAGLLTLQPRTLPERSPGRDRAGWGEHLRRWSRFGGRLVVALLLVWIFYAGAAKLLAELSPSLALPSRPVVWLVPFRVADLYGLFGVMTRMRYEIEFQGSPDGHVWIAYPFRYKPQDLRQPPRFFAPYQPRFDWNLWFASLGPWQQSPFVLRVEELLLENDRRVLELFAGNPFPQQPPRQVRVVVWQYWFADPASHRRGFWWQRRWVGLYAPTLEKMPDGRYAIVQVPTPITTWP